jgi:CRISPR system Cascade subunit CasD
MAFGDVAVDEIRPTRLLPTLSMLTGLLGNALGLDHREVDLLQRLQDRLIFAARLERRGRVIVDYQTARLNKRDPLWTTSGTPGERGGGGSTWDSGGHGTVERHRHFLADALVTLALTLGPEAEPPTIADLAHALRHPERPLFLGRKSCLPATPILLDGPAEHASLAAALAARPLAARADQGIELPIELPDLAGEPEGRLLLELGDRRDWQSGVHAGTRRVRAQARASAASEGGAA